MLVLQQACLLLISTVSDTSPPAAGLPPLTSSDSGHTELIEQLKHKLQFAELKIQLLEERLRQMLIKKYGASSEKLSSEQLQLVELEPGVSSDEVQAESKREALSPQSNDRQARADRKHPGRQSLPAHLPRV